MNPSSYFIKHQDLILVFLVKYAKNNINLVTDASMHDCQTLINILNQTKSSHIMYLIHTKHHIFLTWKKADACLNYQKNTDRTSHINQEVLINIADTLFELK